MSGLTKTLETEIMLTKYEQKMEHKKWAAEIPFLSFEPEWKIKIIPPSGGAVIRFVVTDKEERNHVSVYMDAYDNLGYMGKPYWEIYPSEEGCTERFLLEEIEELIEGIERALNSPEE